MEMSNSPMLDTNISYNRSENDKSAPVVSFSSADNAWRTEILSERDSTFDVGYREDADLGAFLARPQKIFSTTWVVGSDLNLEIDPWSLFMNNENVLRRIQNYYLFRGDLDIKVMINGNGFYYGRLLVNYHPLKSYRLYDAEPGDSLYNVQASQRPHFFVDPTTSTGGEMLLPYFFPKNWINLSFGEFNQLGRVGITTLNSLKQANSSVGAITVNVFACLKNVQLTMPTVNEVGSISPSIFDPVFPIQPESGMMKGSSKANDEYGKGIISKPASTAARMAGSLSNVPIIGKYAMASKFALDGIANVARIFGYSRPPVIDTIKPVKLQPAGYFAPTDADEVVAKLSLDSKQELSIDPTTVGLHGTDQMSMAHVLQRESFLTTFPWSESLPSETVLFNMNVAPVYFASTGVWPTINGRASVTPMSHISQMFQHWRGSIVVRFQIVASQFHKGRIRITWDPYSTGLFSTDEYNVAYNRIIDLAEDRDFEMTFRWGQPEAWLKTRSLSSLATNDVYDTETLSPLAGVSNGMFQVSVVNNLTTPNNTIISPAEINVFVRAGDDFELANPSDGNIQALNFNDPLRAINNKRVIGFDDAGTRILETISPESGNEMTDNGMSCETDNMPVGVGAINSVGGGPISPTDESLMVFMGEKVASLRQLLKRYCWHDCIPLQDGFDRLTLHKQLVINMPVQRGYAVNSKTNDGLGTPYNYVHMTWLNYITPLYAGWRGGIRRKAQTTCVQNTISASVSRKNSSINGIGQTYSQNSFGTGDPAEVASSMRAFGNSARGGAYVTDGVVNPTLEYELPFYSEYRFAMTHTNNDTTTLLRFPDGLHHDLEYFTDDSTPNNPDNIGIIRTAVATGEDFSLFWFLNVPTVYTYFDSATAVVKK